MQRRVIAEKAEPPSTTDHLLDNPTLPITATKIGPSAAKPPFFAPIVKRPTARERFPASMRSHLFRKRFFPDASAADWNDWRWQVRSRVKDFAGLARIIKGGYDALGVMESHLGGGGEGNHAREFFVGGKYSVADIALYAYTHVAHEGGFSLAKYPAIREWLARVKSQPRHIPITHG